MQWKVKEVSVNVNSCSSFYFGNFMGIFFYQLIFGYTGSSLLCMGILIALSGGYSLATVSGLLSVVASLVVEHRFYGTQTSLVVVQRLSCLSASGNFPEPGIKPMPLHW